VVLLVFAHTNGTRFTHEKGFSLNFGDCCVYNASWFHFFMLKIHIPVGITEGLSPNLRMILKSVPFDFPTVFSNTHEKGVRE